jgi:hypothetical protein
MEKAMNKLMSIARCGAFCGLTTLALTAVVSAPAFAQSSPNLDVWTVNIAKSKFGPSTTLVLEHSKAAPQLDANGYPAAHSFFLVSNGKVYLATDEAAVVSGSTQRNVAYSRWGTMKLSQIGDQLKSPDPCGFRCQAGLSDNRSITLTFKTRDGMADELRSASMVAFDRR